MMKIMKWFAALWVAIALSSFGTVAQAESIHVVKTGETLFKIAGKNWKKVCELNKLKDCDRIYPGQKLVIQEGTDGKVQTEPKAPAKAVDKEFVQPAPQQVTAPEPEMIPPVHAKEGDTIPCELQAGVGVYANQIYKGQWQYAEGICYVFKDGEWQHGPGFYAMGGKGESRLSSYHGNERGVGVQYGVQRNFVTDDGDLATFEVKARLLYDQMSGKNLDAGYWVRQKGLKAGLYGSYYERHGDDLVGVIGEYWHGFNQFVRSSWSGQQVQDRGSIGIYGVYEHQLSDDDAWRLRWIGGAQHTDWDSQNWARLALEFRYNEWLMFGPQLSLPLGMSDVNAAFSARDMTTLGAFIRVELGKQARAAYADNREAQLEFIPAHSSSSSASGEPATAGETATSPR